jgi:hypothetical protein
MASMFPAWVEFEVDEDLYVDAKSRGADGAILSTKRTARRYMDQCQASSGTCSSSLDLLLSSRMHARLVLVLLL